MPPVTQTHPDGFPMTLGATPRPHDPREERYAFGATVAPRTAPDLTQPRSLATQAHDYRAPIDPAGQGGVGSCTAWTALECSAAAYSGSGRTNPTLLHPGWIYEKVRKNAGDWPADDGSDTAYTLDVAIAGAPPKDGTDNPYDGSATGAAHDYSDLDPLARPYDDVLSHRPIATGSAAALADLWTAFDQAMPVALEMAWPNAFFTPDAYGVLPEGHAADTLDGYHAITAWEIQPTPGQYGGGVVWCQNHWTAGWNAQAAGRGAYGTARAGDFAIPWSYFAAGSPIITSLRAVTDQPLPQPAPQPTPTPERDGPPPLVPDGFDATLPFDAWLATNAPTLFTTLAAALSPDKAAVLLTWETKMRSGQVASATQWAETLPLWAWIDAQPETATVLTTLAAADPSGNVAGWLAWMKGKGYLTAAAA